MDLPSPPGFYPAVTGQRRDGYDAPIALYGIVTEVEARGVWYRLTGLSFRTRDVWEGPHHPVPQDVMCDASQHASDAAMSETHYAAEQHRRGIFPRNL